MVTLASQNAASKQHTAESKKTGIDASDKDLAELRFELSHCLQSTLDLEKTLKMFFKHACKLVPCAGLSYNNSALQTHIQLGNTAPQRACYNVSSDEDHLGELCLMRKNAFAEVEHTVLEMLIGVLFYPLRNAIKYKQAIEHALIDKLTGAANRYALDTNIEREIKLAKRHNKPLSVLIIDIDHFKTINDSFGHLSGDIALQSIATTIRNSLRETDQVFRYGGEEFVATLAETPLHYAELSAERIRKNIAKQSIITDEHTFSLTASIGIGELNPSDNFESLFDRADNALYHAKHSGRNQVSSFAPKTTKTQKIA